MLIEFLFPLIFTNNIVMSFVKYLANGAMSNVWLRVFLLVCSLMGVIALSSINGTQIDFNSVQSLVKMLAETLVVALGSHFTFKAMVLAPKN